MRNRDDTKLGNLASRDTRSAEKRILCYALAMKRSSAIFLQIVIVLIGICVLALMLWEPHIEGRNVHATLFEIYFKDPFLAYAYIASIPFFVALYQAFKLLGYAGQDKVFSRAAVKALRTMKYCAIAIIGFVAVGEIFIMLNDSDDRAGGVFMGILVTVGSIAIAVVAAIFEKNLRKAVNARSKKDLTVGEKRPSSSRTMNCSPPRPKS